jgi:hypothetical protein
MLYHAARWATIRLCERSTNAARDEFDQQDALFERDSWGYSSAGRAPAWHAATAERSSTERFVRGFRERFRPSNRLLSRAKTGCIPSPASPIHWALSRVHLARDPLPELALAGTRKVKPWTHLRLGTLPCGHQRWAAEPGPFWKSLLLRRGRELEFGERDPTRRARQAGP